MGEAHLQREWEREEVVILVVEYFRTKGFPSQERTSVYQEISDFLRHREEISTGAPVSDTFRNYAGIYMQSGRIRCLDPDTAYCGMQGTKLQKEIVQEYLLDPQKLIAEAAGIYQKYGKPQAN